MSNCSYNSYNEVLGRRRAWLGAGLLGLTLLLVVAVAAAGRAPRACPTERAHVVLADAAVRVVRVRERTSRGASYSRLFACAAGGRPSYALDDPNPEHEGMRAVRVALAGRYVGVGLVYSSSDETEQFARVRVLDVRSGRSSGAIAVAPAADPSDETVTDLVVARSGSAAWIAANRAPSASNANVHQVWLRRRGQRPRLAEADPSVHPGSLALSRDGATVYWSDAAGARSASLKP